MVSNRSVNSCSVVGRVLLGCPADGLWCGGGVVTSVIEGSGQRLKVERWYSQQSSWARKKAKFAENASSELSIMAIGMGGQLWC